MRLTDENGAAYRDFKVERDDPIHALGLQSVAITQSGKFRSEEGPYFGATFIQGIIPIRPFKQVMRL
ncbi:hypothetical protein EON65_42395 [archaeon]|nr:MAG: hypothetical protein EON65_42395 [archaeon]